MSRGREERRWSAGRWLLFVALLVVTYFEAMSRALVSPTFAGGVLVRRTHHVLPALLTYLQWRKFCLEHTSLVALGALFCLSLILVVWRQGLIAWSKLIARVSGTAFRAAEVAFPTLKFDVIREIARRPAGHTFVGMSPRRTFLGWRWSPVYLSAEQRTMHRHVIGKTGSGKTASVLWPSVL